MQKIKKIRIVGMLWQVSLIVILAKLLDIAIRCWAWAQVRYVIWGHVFLTLRIERH
jgi:hypothetical protein